MSRDSNSSTGGRMADRPVLQEGDSGPIVSALQLPLVTFGTLDAWDWMASPDRRPMPRSGRFRPISVWM